nr:reverse transcriptase domain-containing protein [Tanacetum cinerariifolium]
MDEFYDSEVTIIVQRYHWKAQDKRNPSSTIHDSQNAQVPGEWQNGVPQSTAEHRLDIQEGYSLVRQKKGAGPEARQGNPNRGAKTGRGLLPLLEIDWKVESLCGYPFKCFLDACKGYHQIQMAEQDKEKTAFHASHGNLEIYVDELVIKSHTETELLLDIEETFRTLRKINMKLNPIKCTFGAAEGMFIGYMINPKGIKPCPDKTEAMLQLPSPRTIKERCVKKSDFHWTIEAEQAFKQLKQHIAKLPMLVAPKPKEELNMYLSAT